MLVNKRQTKLRSLGLILGVIGVTLIVLGIFLGVRPLEIILFISGFSPESTLNLLDDFLVEMGFFSGIIFVILAFGVIRSR